MRSTIIHRAWWCRAALLMQWTYSYFTCKLGSRIITGAPADHELKP